MLNEVYTIPPYLLFTMVCLISIFIAIVSSRIARKYAFVEKSGSTDGPAAAIAVIYAVFMGFIIFVLLGNFDAAKSEAENEAATINTIIDEFSMFTPADNYKARIIIKDYLNDVINHEWPIMRHEISNDSLSNSTHIDHIDQLMTLLKNYNTTNQTDLQVVRVLVQSISQLRILHQQRLDMARNLELGATTWSAVLIATLAFLISNAFFTYLPNRVYYSLLFLLGITLSAILFLAINLDKPYLGDYSIRPDGFKTVLKLVDHD